MKNSKELSLRTIVIAIQAVDEQVGKYINIVNTTSPEILDPNTELMMHDIFLAANDLKTLYEETVQDVSNFLPYEELVSNHPKLNHIN